MKRTHASLLAAALGTVLTAPFAAELAKEGSYDSNDCFIGPHSVIAFSKDHMGGSYALSGVGLTPENDPFHNTAIKCYGSWTVVNGEYNETGSCEYLDPAGDKMFGVFTRKNQDSGQFRVIAGTGKFTGMTLAGQFSVVTQAQQPAGQISACIRHLG